jgi:hypothetical protein
LNFFWHSWDLDFLHNFKDIFLSNGYMSYGSLFCECTHQYFVHISILIYYGLLEEWTTWWVVYFFLTNYPKGLFYFIGVSHCSKHVSLWEIFEFMPNLPTKLTSEDKWLHRIWPSNRIPPWLSYHIYIMKILQPIHRYA